MRYIVLNTKRHAKIKPKARMYVRSDDDDGGF